MSALQNICILGSTGSIGVNTLDVISRHPELYRVYALTANNNTELMVQQCRQFAPAYAVMQDATSAQQLREALQGSAVQVLEGADGLLRVAAHEAVDCIMAAIVGGIGLAPTMAAVQAGKKVLLANKEALVMAGNLFMTAVGKAGATLLPIDSEHNAIFQCLPVNNRARFDNRAGSGFSRILLTGSGGPFLHTAAGELGKVTPEQACAHPNWKMGRKISVDSATMVNKALELIEASFLFGVPESAIDIMIHPQSIVHSMVYYRDGSVLAQLGNPDMRTPIAYGLGWPDRIEAGVASLDLAAIGRLEFQAPDLGRFPCLKLGREAAKSGGSAPVVLNAANEVAVAAFLGGRLRFDQIPAIIDATLQQLSIVAATSLDMVLEEDRKAREMAVTQVRMQARS